MQLEQSDGSLARLVESLRPAGPFLSRLSVKSGGRIVLVDLASVDWIEAADNYVRLHVRNAGARRARDAGGARAKLDPKTFVRIHRSAIVQVDRVASMRPTSHGDAELTLRDGTRLSVSRTFRDRLRVIG